MSDESSQPECENLLRDKECSQPKGTARENFGSVLTCIAEQVKKVNDARITFLKIPSADPKDLKDLRKTEKDLFNAIKAASKKPGKPNFESLAVELEHKKYTIPANPPAVPLPIETEVIRAVRGRTLYDKNSDTVAPGPIIVEYSSLSSSSSVSGYA